MDSDVKLAFLWEFCHGLNKLLEKWSPQKYSREKEYERDLQNYLKSELPDINVIAQYGAGRVKADLMVNDEIIVELKKGLLTTSNYQKLVGQLEEYKTWKDGRAKIVVLLVGDVDDNLKKEADQVSQRQEHISFWSTSHAYCKVTLS